VNAPVLDLGEDGAEAHQLVLDQEISDSRFAEFDAVIGFGDDLGFI
jgi:hypothetical protein